jgi:hypothetical protein
MSIIFVVVLRMFTALGYEFDECAARVEFESAVDMSNTTARMICNKQDSLECTS